MCVWSFGTTDNKKKFLLSGPKPNDLSQYTSENTEQHPDAINARVQMSGSFGELNKKYTSLKQHSYRSEFYIPKTFSTYGNIM